MQRNRLHKALQQLSKTDLYDWFKMQQWIPGSREAEELIRNGRQGKLINFVYEHVRPQDHQVIIDSVQKLEELREHQADEERKHRIVSQRSQVVKWLQQADDAAARMNNLSSGQVIWIIHEDFV